MQAVRIEGLSFSYKSAPVFSGLSLSVEQGEFLGIIGRTGCGKSTLLLTLNGVIPQMIPGDFSGSVFLLGRDATKTPVHELARSVSFVFQDPDDQVFSLRVEDEVLFGLSNMGITGVEARRRAVRALRKVGLAEHLEADPHHLSYGQKQKLAFACALAVDPQVYVLDEPVSNLDYQSAKEIYGVLRELNRSGKTVIIAEHNTEWLAEYASRIAFLENGKILLKGSPDVLFDKRIGSAGVKVPCSVEISRNVGLKELTPAGIVRNLKKRGR
jgi:energy-coupling factor transporter ATP-binding protein EcfA2